MEVRALLLALTFAACSTGDIVETTTGESFQEQIERECREAGLTCALVYQFTTPADNPLGLVELCVREEDRPVAEAEFGASMLSTHERFDSFLALGIKQNCIWCAGVGCNAYSGCFNCPVP